MKTSHAAILLTCFSFAGSSTYAQVVEQVEDEFYSTPPQSSAGSAELGSHVVMTDRWVFVNAQKDGTIGSSRGSVYVYERTADGLVLNTILYPRGADTTTLGLFGDGGLDARGNRLAVVSTHYIFDLALPLPMEGRLHVYEFNGTSWGIDQVVTAPEYPLMTVPNGFGRAVAFVSDDEVLVGATGDEPIGSNPYDNLGSVYVFRRSPAGTWNLDHKVYGPSQPQRISGFGRHIRSSGDHVIVQGLVKSAELNRQPNGEWMVGSILDFPLQGSAEFMEFDCDDEWLIVGDPQDICELSSQRSRAYVFHRDPGGWTLHQTLMPQDSYAGPIGSCNYGRDKFGTSVDLDGNKVVIGSPSMPVDGVIPAGQASVFELQGNQWVETHTLQLEDPQAWSAFGGSVAIKGDTVAVGARFWTPTPSTPLFHPGAVAIFDLPRGTPVCPGQPNSSGQPATLHVYGNETASQVDIYAEVTELPPGSLCLGLVAAQPGFVMNPAGSAGNLCLSGVIGRFTAQAGAASPSGDYRWQVTPAGMPLATGFVQVQAGSTWVFQSWYRDSVGGTSTSNFSSAVSASFE
ncbi:hypothetical protein Poly30_37150 [Planctomycetes bacterium Poly30]|uniref:Uncharacterized protein n=1 Tax=Saltatorellus ferox TaxID=2528018 RepID=A0A518EVQ9_9BACT|nr:hypothetical protein Poly30_37150 [Planctomycetes bacterium Poly30]